MPCGQNPDHRTGLGVLHGEPVAATAPPAADLKQQQRLLHQAENDDRSSQPTTPLAPWAIDDKALTSSTGRPEATPFHPMLLTSSSPNPGDNVLQSRGRTAGAPATRWSRLLRGCGRGRR